MAAFRKLLTSHVRYMLEHPEELYKGRYEKPQTRGKFFADRRADAIEALKYLSFLAQTLPEKQKKRVFTGETLKPLIEIILSSWEQEKRGDLQNRRVFKIALMLIKEAEDAAWRILPSSKEVALLYDSPRSFDKLRIIRAASRLYSVDLEEEELK